LASQYRVGSTPAIEADVDGVGNYQRRTAEHRKAELAARDHPIAALAASTAGFIGEWRRRGERQSKSMRDIAVLEWSRRSGADSARAVQRRPANLSRSRPRQYEVTEERPGM